MYSGVLARRLNFFELGASLTEMGEYYLCWAVADLAVLYCILVDTRTHVCLQNSYLCIRDFLTPGETIGLLDRARQLLDEFNIEDHPKVTWNVVC